MNESSWMNEVKRQILIDVAKWSVVPAVLKVPFKQKILVTEGNLGP